MNNIKEKIKLYYKELIAPFIAGLIAHGYIMFSYHPNRDEFISIFHHGSGYDFGRWMHTAIGNFMFRIDGCWSLPWLSGLVFIALITLSIYLFIEPFNISNKIIRQFLMILFVVFPVSTATLACMATAPFYALGVFFAAVAFYISVKYKYGFIFAILGISAAVGVYQVYFALAAAFVFFLFFLKIARNEEKIKNSFIWAGKQLLMLSAGLGLYFVINKIVVTVKNVKMTDYQNLDHMGNYAFSSIINAFIKCYSDFFSFFIKDYKDILPYKILNIVLIIEWLCFAILCVYLIIKKLKKAVFNIVVLLGLIMLIPFAINLINIMCAESIETISVLMCYNVFFMFAAPFFILDEAIKEGTALSKLISKLSLCAIGFVIVIYIKFANMVYLAYDIHFEQAKAEMSALQMMIRSLDGYDNELPIVFAGEYKDNTELWELRYADNLAGAYTTGYIMNNEAVRAAFSRIFMGFLYGEENPTDELMESREFKEMPSYPDAGSVKVIDNEIVVKFSDK